MRRHFWSNSKFADWIRGTPKPSIASLEDWDAWEKAAQHKPRRFWLAEDGLDSLQDFIYWPIDFIYSIRSYISNRWITKTHGLTSNLKRGEWYDFDERLLHAAFDEFVNFVEEELAIEHAIWSEDGEKYKMVLRQFSRCPAAGIARLEWASGLRFNAERGVDQSDPRWGQPTPQALTAQESLELYRWWKEERPKRPDKWDSDLREKYENEDTDHLIRLVKVRHTLWT